MPPSCGRGRGSSTGSRRWPTSPTPTRCTVPRTWRCGSGASGTNSGAFHRRVTVDRLVERRSRGSDVHRPWDFGQIIGAIATGGIGARAEEVPDELERVLASRLAVIRIEE